MIGLILATVLAVVTGQLMIKTGVAKGGPIGSARGLLIRMVQPLVLLGLAVYAASAAAWIYILASEEVSYAFPFLGLTYVCVAVIAVLVLRERLAAVQWVGLALVVAGVTIVAVS